MVRELHRTGTDPYTKLSARLVRRARRVAKSTRLRGDKMVGNLRPTHRGERTLRGSLAGTAKAQVGRPGKLDVCDSGPRVHHGRCPDQPNNRLAASAQLAPQFPATLPWTRRRPIPIPKRSQSYRRPQRAKRPLGAKRQVVYREVCMRSAPLEPWPARTRALACCPTETAALADRAPRSSTCRPQPGARCIAPRA